jgi:HlyD family secretion protein
VREATGALAVPAAAVLRGEGGDLVWRVRDGRAERVPVRLGVHGRDLVQVVSGLRAGDRVVVRDADLVTEGQRLP